MKVIEQRLIQAIQDKVFPGCTFGVVTPTEMKVMALGKFKYSKDSSWVEPSTMFDVASITKSIPTGLLALQLIEEGKLSFDTQIAEFFPEHTGETFRTITIKNLLHADVKYSFQFSKMKHWTPQAIWGRLLTEDIGFWEEGEEPMFTNGPLLLLTKVLEKVTEKPFAELAQEKIFSPLKMENTTFFPTDEQIPKITPTEIDEERGGTLQGIVHDESAWALTKESHLAVGSAGLFSTTFDLLQCLNALLENTHFPKQIMDWSSQGLGWEKNKEWMGESINESVFGKTGFTGTSILVDPENKRAFVLLSNAVHPKRHEDRAIMNQVRKDVHELFLV